MLLLAALGVYTFTIRVWDIHRHFWMHGEQIRDWLIATGPMYELPLVGTPSTAGGTSLGPSYYWTLWGIAQVVGPWFDRLPHAGGIGLSLVQSLADVLLAYAIWRRLGSLVLALAVVLVAASSPHDLAISATIWNPVLAVAFAKMALALLLLYGQTTSSRAAAATAAVAWLAVQAHSGALFLAGACLLWFVVRELAAGRVRDAAATAFGLQLVVLALQIPFLIHLLRRPAAGAAPTVILETLGQSGESGALNPLRSARAISAALDTLLASPWPFEWFGLLLAGCAGVVVVRRFREPDLIFATVVPVALAVAAFSTWTRPFDSYWFLPIVPSTVLLVALAVVSLPWARVAPVVAPVLLMLALVIQPARISRSHEFLRLPEYEALVRGSRQAAKYGAPLARINADFLDPDIDREVLFRLLGGEIRRDAPLVATIDRDGTVRFDRDRRGRD
jgi:hypothetical protein